jgi:superfamily II DNA/RNA helicase
VSRPTKRKAPQLSDQNSVTSAGEHAGPAPAPEAEKRFRDYPIRPETYLALEAAGKHSPFPIQSLTLPVALGGRDIIGQAKTGTGKTLGFGIPVLEQVEGPGEAAGGDPADLGLPQALIVLPTRELAIQVSDELAQAASRRSVRVLTIYGGRSYEPQVEALQKGVEVVVGTPGRLLDLNRQKILDLSKVRFMVLDEADEMLDLGFLDDVERLMQAVPGRRQTMLFSATMPGPVVALARRFMNQPTHIRAHDPNDLGRTKADIKQVIYRAHSLDKIEVLARILQAEGRDRTIVFTRTKRQADRVSGDLIERGFAAAPLHGDLGQGAREQALRAFRHGKVDVLIATDVAARGIDVADVSQVVNYQCPDDEKIYLHRTGRTGRAGKKGTAITFVDWEDIARWSLIAKNLGLDQTEPVETYSTSEHLFADLSIPRTAKGTLPKDQRTRAGLDAEVLEDLGGPDAARGERSGGSSRGGSGRSGSSRGGSGRSSGSGRSGERSGGSSHGGSGRSSGGSGRGERSGGTGRSSGGSGRGERSGGSGRSSGGADRSSGGSGRSAADSGGSARTGARAEGTSSARRAEPARSATPDTGTTSTARKRTSRARRRTRNGRAVEGGSEQG